MLESSTKSYLKQFLINTSLGAVLMILPRSRLAGASVLSQAKKAAQWLVSSREYTNFSYRLSTRAYAELVPFVSIVTGVTQDLALNYLEEIRSDSALAADYAAKTLTSDRRWASNLAFLPTRQLLAYMLVRATKPRITVEAGVDKGLGGMLLCSALRRNESEGIEGSYVGLEANRNQSCFLLPPLVPGKVDLIYGDSVEYLRNRADPGIDFFVHDSASDPVHMEEQLNAFQAKSTCSSILLCTWYTPQFELFAKKHGYHFLSFLAEPAEHWHSGDRPVVMWKAKAGRLRAQGGPLAQQGSHCMAGGSGSDPEAAT